MALVGALGYATVALLYTVVFVLSILSWQGGRIGRLIIVACIVGAIWAGTLAIHTGLSPVSPLLLFCVEVLHLGAWIAFLGAMDIKRGVGKYLGMLFQMAWLMILLAGVGLWVAMRAGIDVPQLDSVLIPGGLVLSLCGLVLTEQLYRNSNPEARLSIKTLALGLGGIFAFDLFLYSQSVLFGSVDAATWNARGAVNILFVPMIAIAVRRNDHWYLDIFVSRHVVFYTTTFVAVGIYLILMSAGGYAISYFGGSWTALLQIVFVAGAALVLAVLLFSDQLRSRLKVFLNKHFFRNKYDYREEWLRLVETLAEFENIEAREIVIKALSQVVDSPGGVLWSLDETAGEYRQVATYNTDSDVPSIEFEESLVQFVQKNHWLIDLDEFFADPGFYENIELPNWLTENKKAWLIVPLIIRQTVHGMVLLEKTGGKLTLNYEDRDLLKIIGNHLAVHLAQQTSESLLAESRQFEAYNRLTAFLMHDLNNLIAQQSLIIKNAERHKSNPEFIDDVLQTVANSVSRMKSVMDHLRRGNGELNVKATPLNFMLSAAVDHCSDRSPQPTLDLQNTDIEVNVDRDRFVMVLTHLLRNAQDATPASGMIRLSATRAGGDVLINVEDNGAGMSPEFIRDRLFRPFDSTKGSQGMGIGVYQARDFARSLGGDLKVRSEPGRGTVCIMSIPYDD